MCGIAGMLSVVPRSEYEIVAMKEALAHRGPDASGSFVSDNKRILLGHTRLSILDLSDAAGQPFYSHDGKYVIVFNGEIYNFKTLRQLLAISHGVAFKTTSDTEVLAEGFSAWGARLVEHLEGMFAFAVADLGEGRIHLFRDRVGKKPLYYCEHETGFYFASEIKALLKVPELTNAITVDPKSIATFLHLGYIPEPNSIYKEIKKFPAGCMGEIGSDKVLALKRYWSLNETLNHRSKILPNKEEALIELLRDSVQSRLLSDVPLGTFLSGGTDSSLVTALATTLVPRQLRTFSIGFRENSHNESHYAEAVARRLKTDHTTFELSQQDALPFVEAYLNHFDEPFADTSAIPTMLVSRLARQQVTVALTGDGGDELFQGYGSYAWANRLNAPHWKLLKHPLRAMFELTTDSRMQRISDLLASAKYGGIRSHIFSQEQYFFSQAEIQESLLRHPSDKLVFNYGDPVNGKSSQLSSGELQALFDFHYYLKDDLLVKVDMASMYYGLECRCPLLDHRVVEFAFGLPVESKIHNGETKWILKKILKRFLPDELVFRKKWGFSIPLGEWLKKDLKYLIDQYLNPEMIHAAGLVNAEEVRKLLIDFFGGRDYLYHRIWLLIVLHCWWSRHIEPCN